MQSSFHGRKLHEKHFIYFHHFHEITRFNCSISIFYWYRHSRNCRIPLDISISYTYLIWDYWWTDGDIIERDASGECLWHYSNDWRRSFSSSVLLTYVSYLFGSSRKNTSLLLYCCVFWGNREFSLFLSYYSIQDFFIPLDSCIYM